MVNFKEVRSKIGSKIDKELAFSIIETYYELTLKLKEDISSNNIIYVFYIEFRYVLSLIEQFSSSE